MYARTHVLRKAVAAATTAAVALGGALVVAGAPAHAALKTVPTPFAYQGSAFGTRVTLGDPHEGGVTSGRTAWSVLPCTKLAPIRREGDSDVSRLAGNPMIQVGAVTSLTSTYRRPARDVYGSRSVNKVAELTVGAEDGPRLVFGAVTTVAVAFNDDGRFGGRTRFEIADLRAIDIDPGGSETPGALDDLLSAIDSADDQLVTAVIESSGGGIDVPGVGTIYPAGKQRTSRTPRSAAANAYGIRILLEDGSRAVVGRAWARIQKAPRALFGGLAYGYTASIADGSARLGRTPFQPMRCIGTGGTWEENPLVSVTSPGLTARSLNAAVLARPFDDGRAVARARAAVGELSIGDRLVVQGVVGKVNVFQDRSGRVRRRNVQGTRIGAIVVDGEPHEAPGPGESLEIPGLATVEGPAREKVGSRGLRVTALRVRMLDGSGLHLEIGTAVARIRR